MYIYIYIYMYVCMYVYIYMNVQRCSYNHNNLPKQIMRFMSKQLFQILLTNSNNGSISY